MPAPVPSIAERSLLLGSALTFGSFAALLAALEIAVLIQPSRLIGYSEAEWLGLFGLWIPAVATVSAMGARVLGSRALRRTARAARPRRRRFSLSIAWVIPWLILCDWRWREAANLRMEQGEAVRREGVRRMLRLVPTNGDAQHGSVLFDALSCQGCHGRDASGTSAAPGLWRLADRSAIRRGDQSPWDSGVTSILDPYASLNPDFPRGGMSTDFWQSLSPQDVADLAAYVLSLR